MRAIALNNINKLYFSTADIARELEISHASAKVSATRYVKKNILIRLKPDLYILASQITILTDLDRFRLANIVQTPSYISLTTALSYFGVSTQQQQNFLESIAIKRTKSVEAGTLQFTYHRIKKELYEGFELEDGCFLAPPEKALADAVYLSAIGRYNCDFHAIDFGKIEIARTAHFIKRTNKTTEIFWGKLCANFKI